MLWKLQSLAIIVISVPVNLSIPFVVSHVLSTKVSPEKKKVSLSPE